MRERAFIAWVPGIVDGKPPEGGGLFRTTSAGRARYLCFLAARDASFDVTLPDVKVRRAPEYDRHSFRNGVMPKYATPSAASPVVEAAATEGGNVSRGQHSRDVTETQHECPAPASATREEGNDGK